MVGQVNLQYLAPEPGKPDSEIVHAKYVVGADGKPLVISCIRAPCIPIAHRCALMDPQDIRHHHGRRADECAYPLSATGRS